jgi:hypothetical protein
MDIFAFERGDLGHPSDFYLFRNSEFNDDRSWRHFEMAVDVKCADLSFQSVSKDDLAKAADDVRTEWKLGRVVFDCVVFICRHKVRVDAGRCPCLQPHRGNRYVYVVELEGALFGEK